MSVLQNLKNFMCARSNAGLTQNLFDPKVYLVKLGQMFLPVISKARLRSPLSADLIRHDQSRIMFKCSCCERYSERFKNTHYIGLPK